MLPATLHVLPAISRTCVHNDLGPKNSKIILFPHSNDLSIHEVEYFSLKRMTEADIENFVKVSWMCLINLLKMLYDQQYSKKWRTCDAECAPIGSSWYL